MLEVHDITVSDVVDFVKLEKHESPCTDWVRAVERKDTERNVGTLRQILKAFDLRLHYGSVAETPKQDRFVENGRKLERIVSCQYLLPG